MKFGLYLPCIMCGVIFSVALNLLYFLKKHIDVEETKIFSRLLVANLAGLFGEFICSLCGYNLPVDSQLPHIATKIFLMEMLLFVLFMTLYIFVTCYITSNRINYQKYSLLKKISWIVTLISFPILICLPISTYVGYANGLACDFTYLLCFFAVFVWIFYLIKEWKYINKKKVTPILLYIVFLALTAIIQKINPQITITTIIEFLVVFILYHTIENPDLIMLNEYVKNKELVESSTEEKSNVLFKVSQEVRNPLRKINLLGNNIISSNKVDEMHNSARDIVNISNSVSNIINNVLDITDLDKRNVKIVDTTYNIYNLFSQIIYFGKEKESNVEFKYSINNVIPKELHGDSARLKQIICSILNNAFKNTEKGYVDLDISNIIKYDICRLIITISDTGKGMSLEKINNIMGDTSEIDEKELMQLNKLDISLKLVKKLIDIQGGSMMISSGERGTVFTVVIDQVFDDKNNFASLDKVSKNISNKKRVLIVDDDYTELTYLSKEFKRNSFEVVTTMYGKDCIDKVANNEEYDYIIIDDEMDNYNAVKTISEIEKKIDVTKLNVIVLLGKDKEFIKEHYLEDYPFTDYLLKNNYKNEITRIINKK